MIVMKTEDFNRFLQQNNIHVFSINDAARIIGKPKHYATIFISRDRIIKRAENGVYYTPDASSYEVASEIVYPSYVSLISALRLHNLTEQIPNMVYIVSTKMHKDIELDSIRIKFFKVKGSLMYGYLKMDGAFVAEPEKAVVDMLYLNRFNEYAMEAIESGKLDMKKLLNYAELSGKKRLIREVTTVAKALDKKRTYEFNSVRG
ncbi:hypothetical protein B2A_03567 [mine drainage metagenome]|uniref:Transcriptional regulator n=1 Tax=mine drainage metagenome TaxID=410659 RepID=T1C5Z1_9ZZZZ